MDNLTKEQRRKNMQNIRSTGTKPEELIMKELKRRKIYFASHVKKIKGTPAIVFRRKKVVVFIDSDFWHGHPKRFVMPKTNTEYWKNKIRNNKRRDVKVNRTLKQDGWNVVRIWEHDVKRKTDKCILKILNAIDRT